MHGSQLVQEEGWRVEKVLVGKSPPACTRGLDATVTPQKGQETLDMWVQSVVPLSWGLPLKVWKTQQGSFPSQLNPLALHDAAMYVWEAACA